IYNTTQSKRTSNKRIYWRLLELCLEISKGIIHSGRVRHHGVESSISVELGAGLSWACDNTFSVAIPPIVKCLPLAHVEAERLREFLAQQWVVNRRGP